MVSPGGCKDIEKRALLLRGSHFYEEEIQKEKLKYNTVLFKTCFKRVENGVVTRTEPLGMEKVEGSLDYVNSPKFATFCPADHQEIIPATTGKCTSSQGRRWK